MQTRLKRLLQEDEDVGRVSKVVPALVSKAIELFIHDLVVQSGGCAQSKKSKSVSPEHVREVVLRNEQYDFLRDLMPAGDGE